MVSVRELRAYQICYEYAVAQGCTLQYCSVTPRTVEMSRVGLQPENSVADCNPSATLEKNFEEPLRGW